MEAAGGSHWTGGKAPLPRPLTPPPLRGIRRVDGHSDRRGPRLARQRPSATQPGQSAREVACCMPRHGAMPLTAMPGGMGRGGGAARPPGPQSGSGVRPSCYTTQSSERQTRNSKDTQASSDQLERSPLWKWCSRYRQLVPMKTHTHTHIQGNEEILFTGKRKRLIIQDAKYFFHLVSFAKSP